MQYVTRSEWGARNPSGSRNALDPHPLGAGVHWNGPGCASALRTHDRCAPFLRGIQDFHMGPQRGWSDIAYSLFVCPHGSVFEGRGKGVGTAAFGTNHGNRFFYAIYAMWGQGDGPAPQAMLDGITDAVALTRSWGAGTKVIGHRDENKSTECPGDELYRLVHSGRFEPTSKATAPKKAGALDVDGLFGPATIKAIEKWTKSPIRGTWTIWDVKALQRTLGVKVDGDLGPATTKALQRKIGAHVDGIWPRHKYSETTAKLQRYLNQWVLK